MGAIVSSGISTTQVVSISPWFEVAEGKMEEFKELMKPLGAQVATGKCVCVRDEPSSKCVIEFVIPDVSRYK
mgnify:CR=1 FL=1